jgi:fumarate hydratase subunit beta
MKLENAKRIETPLRREVIASLRAGDWVLLSGVIYTARDQAHRRMVETLVAGKALPVSLLGQVIYYCGPTPARPGRVIGSAGPTTGSRMDKYLEPILGLGVLATIGKGERSKEARALFKKFGALYLVSIGGAGAYLSERIKRAKVAAWPELGTEAVHELEVEDFPGLVAYDGQGGDYFEKVFKGAQARVPAPRKKRSADRRVPAAKER